MSPSETAARSRRGGWFAAGALAVAAAAFLAVAVGGIGDNLVYYWGPSELQAAGEKAVGATIRLGGQVAPGSVVPGEGASDLAFDVTDGRAAVHVRARGVPPQMFREGVGVVVEGTMTPGGTFDGRRLLVSHDNEYRPPGAGQEVEARELMGSTAGMEVPAEGERP